MDAIETGQVLELIRAHYWQETRKTERERLLQIATWTEVLSDIPREPHVNLALADWFESQRWSPQASQLRELALELGGPTPTMIAEAERWRQRRANLIPIRQTAQDGEQRVAAVEAWIAAEAERQGISHAMVASMARLDPGWREMVRLGIPSHWRPEWTPHLETIQAEAEVEVAREPLAIAGGS